MARRPRKDVFDPHVVGVYHCHNRCVRQCFLLGDDALTGRNFDHRKQWFVDRFQQLARCFAIELLSYAVMENHFHVVLRDRPDVLARWSDEEVARRWLLLCPVHSALTSLPVFESWKSQRLTAEALPRPTRSSSHDETPFLRLSALQV